MKYKLKEYCELVKAIRQSDEEVVRGKQIMTKSRGDVYFFGEMTVAYATSAFHELTKEFNFSAKLFEIVEAEFDTLINGTDKFGLYENDNVLKESYNKLGFKLLNVIKKYRQNKYSANNVLTNELTCISSLYFFNNKLTVISRSLDLYKAGYSDLLLINKIAVLADVKYVEIKFINTHVYVDNFNGKSNEIKTKEPVKKVLSEAYLLGSDTVLVAYNDEFNHSEVNLVKAIKEKERNRVYKVCVSYEPCFSCLFTLLSEFKNLHTIEFVKRRNSYDVIFEKTKLLKSKNILFTHVEGV